MASKKEKIVAYIQKSGQATVADLADILGIERAMVHRHLNDLLERQLIGKVGLPPKVVYVLPAENKRSQDEELNLTSEVKKVIDEHFLLVTPQGDRIDGCVGFARWCADRHCKVKQKAGEYVTLYMKYAALRKNGLFDGTQKVRDTFVHGLCYVDKVYYVDFYAWEIFGKTKLGQLLLYAKQSQSRKMVKDIAETVSPHVNYLVQKYSVQAIGYIPPTVKRTVQFMDVLEKNISVNVPVLKVEKVVGALRVPQKTLTKLSDRIQNAQATIFVTDKRMFDTVLLIDDAVGSGATFNEVAKKLKNQGVAKKVICLAITGSVKGFDVISEV